MMNAENDQPQERPQSRSDIPSTFSDADSEAANLLQSLSLADSSHAPAAPQQLDISPTISDADSEAANILRSLSLADSDHAPTAPRWLEISPTFPDIDSEATDIPRSLSVARIAPRRMDIPSTYSDADLEAGNLLQSLSLADSDQTPAAPQRSGSQHENIPTTTQGPESVVLNGHLMFSLPEGPALNSPGWPLFQPYTDHIRAQLISRLQNITLAHDHHGAPETGMVRSKLDSFQVICFHQCSAVPTEIAVFFHTWLLRGYTAEAILETLLVNNIIIPDEYIYR